VVYLDFQKAFDKVPHKCLSSKLKSYGLTGMVFNWIADFLYVVCCTSSKWSPVTSGVPRDNILGPILFTIIYVNDLPDVIVASLLKIQRSTVPLHHKLIMIVI